MRVLPLAFVVLLAVSATPGAQAATPPPGGANQRSSLEGCTNQWLFNGVWRLRATAVGPIEDFGTKGIGVKIQARNGTTKTLQPGTSGLDGQGAGIQLIGADGNGLPVDAGAYQTQFGYKSIVQGATLAATLRFHFQSPADADSFKPAKLIVQFDQRNVQVPGVRYATKTPSLRIDLTCDAAKKA